MRERAHTHTQTHTHTHTHHRFPAGVTVAYVKMQVEQQHGLSNTVLKLGSKVLIDPFSLCDYPEMQPGATVTVTVEQRGA